MSNYTFNNVPSLKYKRTKINMPHGHSTSFNAGDLVPVDLIEVLPGDTWKQNMTYVCRTSTPFVRPIMGNLFADTYSFFVPLRLLYDDLEKVFGDPTPSAWLSNTLKKCPTFSAAQTVTKGTVADHLGLPVGSSLAQLKGKTVLPFRAFAKIYNDWFRNENITDETYMQTGAFSSAYETLNNNIWGANNYCGKLPKVAKTKDYFTSCLLKPQKGNPVLAPASLSGSMAVVPSASVENLPSYGGTMPSLKWRTTDGSIPGSGASNGDMTGVYIYHNEGAGFNYDDTVDGNEWVEGSGADATIYPSNLVVNSIGGSLGLNVNDLRFAVQAQKMLELDARTGGRYCEYLLGHYGVNNGDARMQRSEFLGGNRQPIQIQQVTSTNAGTDADNPGVGQVGAFSITGATHQDRFVKSFTEHGYIITVMCIRQIHMYSQGIDKLWFRDERAKFYDPLFAHLGEQPVYNAQLCANTADADDKVFGYNEAWADMRYLPNKLTGEMRPSTGNLGALWTIGDSYANKPTLSDTFILETEDYLDNVLSAPSTTCDQFIVDIQYNTSAIRVMPLYSVPGLLDHTLI